MSAIHSCGIFKQFECFDNRLVRFEFRRPYDFTKPFRCRHNFGDDCNIVFCEDYQSSAFVCDKFYRPFCGIDNRAFVQDGFERLGLAYSYRNCGCGFACNVGYNFAKGNTRQG